MDVGGPPAPLGRSTSPHVRLLFVEDDPLDRRAFLEFARREGLPYQVSMAASVEEAKRALKAGAFEIIVSDYILGDGVATDLFPHRGDAPIIVATGQGDEEIAVGAMKAGAYDYIVKDVEGNHLKTLPNTLKNALDHRSAQAELLRKQARLEEMNRELEAFNYSVSHDLQAPLRAIDAFSGALLEDHAERLDAEGLDYLQRIQAATRRLGRLLEDLMRLSRIARGELEPVPVDLSALARGVAEELKDGTPSRRAEFHIGEDLVAEGDGRLLQILLTNLLGNAWKFTRDRPVARIAFGRTPEGTFFVEDNGAGFDMAYAQGLFTPFTRLHPDAEFEGTGIGLAICHRIVARHGGRIWAEGRVGQGAVLRFTLSEGEP